MRLSIVFIIFTLCSNFLFFAKLTFAEDFQVDLVKVEYYKDNKNTKCTSDDYILVRELFKVYNVDISDLVYTRVNSDNEPYNKLIKYVYKSGNELYIPYGYCMDKNSSLTTKIRFLSLKSGRQSNIITLNIKPSHIMEKPVPHLVPIK